MARDGSAFEFSRKRLTLKIARYFRSVWNGGMKNDHFKEISFGRAI